MKFITLLLLSIMNLTAQVKEFDMVKDITPLEAKQLLSEQVVVLDVRTENEFQTSHIEGAQNYDVKKDDFEELISKLNKEETYIVHCKSGGRSSKAIKIMSKLGFKNILHMKAGMDAYSKLK